MSRWACLEVGGAWTHFSRRPKIGVSASVICLHGEIADLISIIV
jgi:hypothetical protein